MSAAELIALADRCEALATSVLYSEARRLDDAIYTAIFGTAPFNSGTAPRYHASLDAAMTLVPEGWCWTINTFGEPNCSASAYLIAETNKMVRPERQYIATPALALTAAALRARAASPTRGCVEEGL